MGSDFASRFAAVVFGIMLACSAGEVRGASQKSPEFTKGKEALAAPVQDLRTRKPNARECLQKGLELMAAKDYADAVRAFSQAIYIDEGFLQILRNTVSMHIRYRNQDRANDDLEKMGELEHHLSSAYYYRASAFQGMEKYPEAIRDYDWSLKLDPDCSRAYLDKGRVLQKIGEFRKAADQYSQFLKKEPENAAAYVERGRTYLGLGFFPLAVLDGDRAIELDRQNAQAYCLRGVSYQRGGNLARGLEDLKRGAALGSQEAGDLLRSQGVE